MKASERELLLRFCYRLALHMTPSDLTGVLLEAKRSPVPINPLSPPILDWARLVSERIIPATEEEK